jgi:hypothetical protein
VREERRRRLDGVSTLVGFSVVGGGGGGSYSKGERRRE